MKIDRLIGIVSILLQEEKITAPQLAEHFEVSRRTINRDIETLCQAGLPIMTMQGGSGGICIMEGYKVDRALLTSKDMQMILAGLRSLDSISGSHYYTQLMERLKIGSSQYIDAGNIFLIDLASWYKETLIPKIKLIEQAVEEKKLLTFQYYSPKGESDRKIEPYYLVFHWSNWYVWGYCLKREDFRMFKVNRMENLKVTAQFLESRQIILPNLDYETIYPPLIKVKALFEPEEKWRLVDEFGINSFTEQPDGKLLFAIDYSDADSLITWLLSFKSKVELLEPKYIRGEMKKIAEAISHIYSEKEN